MYCDSRSPALISIVSQITENKYELTLYNNNHVYHFYFLKHTHTYIRN